MTGPTLHLVCGKVASGKSTLAIKLARENHAILLSEDEFLRLLFGDVMKTLKDYVHYSGKVKQVIRPIVLQLLARGISVVLDFPANTLSQREWLRDLANEADCVHTLHFLDVPDAACKARLRQRTADGSHPFQVSEEQFDQITHYFVAPTSDEGFNLVVHGT